MLSSIRDFFGQRDVLEVETPSLCNAIGPDPNLDFFDCMMNHADGTPTAKLYLQTSPEFSMKRLLAAGSGSIYQICKAFRNGEVGRFHNPEFTILEWYRIDFTLDLLMDEVADLLNTILASTQPSKAPVRVSYSNIFLEHCGIDPLLADISKYNDCAQRNNLIEASGICGGDIKLWQEFLFTHLVEPHLETDCYVFIFGFPRTQASLARTNPQNQNIVDRFEVFYRGVELANGFHELTDLNEQTRRFDDELRQRAVLEKSIPSKDLRFLAALQSGIPECAGVAVGLDRLLMLLVDADSIEDVLAFPVSRA